MGLVGFRFAPYGDKGCHFLLQLEMQNFMLAADHLHLSHFSILTQQRRLFKSGEKQKGIFYQQLKFYLHANVNQPYGGFVRVAQILFQFRLIRRLRCTFDVYVLVTEKVYFCQKQAEFFQCMRGLEVGLNYGQKCLSL